MTRTVWQALALLGCIFLVLACADAVAFHKRVQRCARHLVMDDHLFQDWRVAEEVCTERFRALALTMKEDPAAYRAWAMKPRRKS